MCCSRRPVSCGGDCGGGDGGGGGASASKEIASMGRPLPNEGRITSGALNSEARPRERSGRARDA